MKKSIAMPGAREQGSDRFVELQTFVLVAQQGSFSAAARLREVSPSAVSKIVARLETRLGVQLLRRSTRRLELTAEGEQLLEQGRQLLADWLALESSVTQQGQPAGVVRINASSSTGNRLLVPLVGPLMQTWPGLQLDLSFTDHVVDLIAARADIALRWGELPSSDMVARRLGHTRQVIVASPEYLQRFGRPTHPDELAGHVRIGWNYPRAIPHWPFVVAGQAVTVGMGEVLRVNDGEAMANLAMAGAGLARLSLYHAWDDLHAGRLEVVLEDFNPGDLQPIHAVYVGKPGQLPVRTRAVLDFLASHVDLSHAEHLPADFPKGNAGA
ncbi:LysR family transcriptional regulator [Comamonas testosteroni]|uniref:LysR family transcriptional regulator n=1 Tax=Comamonas testosteroni TaxID=285 RepID=UPI002DB865C1|nr:LysR family transcriptional regulator [Comamonas testosteroni]MEB5963897.1 LysR family transcriptional regulator [Comamonas testosteroni]